MASGSFNTNLNTIAASTGATALATASASAPIIVNYSPTLQPTLSPTYTPGAPTPIPTEQPTVMPVPSNYGYVFTTTYADICTNSTSSGDAIYQLGYITNDCLPIYNSNGTVTGSRYITCNVTSSTVISYNSSDCDASAILESITTDNNICSNSIDWFNPTLNRSQVTQCLEYPASYNSVTELLSSVLPFDAVLTTSYGNGSGCNTTIIEFSAIATDICFSTLYNSTFEQSKGYTCYGNGVGYYEFYPVPKGSNDTCALIEDQYTLSSECELLQMGSGPYSTNSTASASYYSLSQCYIATPPPDEPTLSPTYTPSPTTVTQYVLFNEYIDETCYGDVDLQVGYLTNTCISDVSSSIGISSFIASCTSQNITFQEFSTANCSGTFNTSTIETSNCMHNSAGFCKEVGSYYDLVLMDAGNKY